MKNPILNILFCCVMILVITGCRNSTNDFEIGKKTDIQNFQHDVSLYIKEGTLTNTGATLVLTNNSDKDFQYGNPYEIEIKKDGEWHKINAKLNFTLPAYSLKSGETKEIELSWEHGYGKLSNGTYRIIKDIDYEKEDVIFEKFSLAVEFSIE